MGLILKFILLSFEHWRNFELTFIQFKKIKMCASEICDLKCYVSVYGILKLYISTLGNN